MSGVPSGGNMWKNIIIGIVTTVVAYLIVHFLLDKSSSKEDLKKKRADITEAWRSVTEYTERSRQKFKTLACFSCNEQEMKKEIMRELDKNINSLNAILKSKNLDDVMQTIIDRSIDKFNDLKPVCAAFFDSVTYSTTLPDDERMRFVPGLQARFFEKRAYLETRDTKDIQDFLNDLNKKYKTDLVLEPEKIEYQPDALIRKWNVECLFTIRFRDDNTLTWTEAGEDIKGTWSLVDKVLRMTLTNGQNFEYTIVELAPNYMAMYVPEVKAVAGACPIN